MSGALVRFARKALLAALVAYCLVIGVTYLRQGAMLYPGATGGEAAAERWGEAVIVDTPDGERLFALHAPAPQGRPTILFFHGNGDRATRFGFMAEALRARSIGLFVVSWRGYPGSTGTPSETGLLADGLASFDWLSARTSGPIVPVGHSLGTGVAVHVAAERGAPGLVILSAYDSIAEVAAAQFPYLPVRALIRDPWRTDARIGGVAAPKLFIHGARDTVIPLSNGTRLFDRTPEPKSMIVVEQAEHNDLLRPAIIGRIADFVDEIALP